MRAAWREGCQFGGVDWPYEWADDAQRAGQVFTWSGARYGAKTPEQFARIWNGGPSGASKKATLAYWSKVKANLENET
jgi:hypothetical protein